MIVIDESYNQLAEHPAPPPDGYVKIYGFNQSLYMIRSNGEYFDLMDSADGHIRSHNMDSGQDHLNTIPNVYPVTNANGEWKLEPKPTSGTVDNSTRLISGSYVAGTGYEFLITNTSYKIWGVLYNTMETTVTLDAADAENDRIDLICLNTSQEVIVLKGVPSVNPATPVPDPYLELAFTSILVKAGTTEPEITTVQVYDENVEWATSCLNAGVEATTIEFESIVDPIVNSKCIVITKLQEEGIRKAEIYFEGTDTTLGEDAVFAMRLKSTAPWIDSSAMEIVLKRNGVQVGSSVLIVGNSYGNNSTMPAWNQIVIPIADFNATGLIVDEIDIRFSYTEWFSTGNALKIDDVKLQFGGVVTPPVVVGTEIIIPKLQLDAGRYYNSNINVREALDTLRCFWQQNNKEFLNHNPEIWMFRKKRHIRNVQIITGGYYQKLNKKWMHPPHLNGAKFPGGNFFSGTVLHPVADVATDGYHSEWEMTNIEPLKKMVIPVDQFEIIYERDSNIKLTESSFSELNPLLLRMIDKGALKSLALSFAIVIDNPNFAEDGCPKLIGEYSDSIYLTIQRTFSLDKNMTVWCKSPRSRT